MGRLRFSAKADERSTYHLVVRRSKRPLDPAGLQGVNADDREKPEFEFWQKRGGTPGGVEPKHAPVPVSAAMRLWLRLDEELTGALTDAGFHHPGTMNEILTLYLPDLRLWFRDRGLPFDSDFELLRDARRLLRAIGAGRAAAHAERREGGA